MCAGLFDVADGNCFLMPFEKRIETRYSHGVGGERHHGRLLKCHSSQQKKSQHGAGKIRYISLQEPFEIEPRKIVLLTSSGL